MTELAHNQELSKEQIKSIITTYLSSFNAILSGRFGQREKDVDYYMNLYYTDNQQVFEITKEHEYYVVTLYNYYVGLIKLEQ